KAYDLFSNHGQHKEALEEIKMHMDQMPEDYEDTRRFDALNMMAILYDKLEKYSESLEHLKQAIQIELSEAETNNKIMMYRMMGEVARKMDHIQKSVEFDELAYEMSLDHFGENDFAGNTQRHRKHLASVLMQLSEKKGDKKRGIKSDKERGVEMQQEWISFDKKREGNSIDARRREITFLISPEGNNMKLARSQAKSMLKEIRNKRDVSVEHKQELIKAIDICALVENADKKYEKAVAYFTQALPLRLEVYADDTPKLVDGYTNLASMYTSLKQDRHTREALRLWRKALDIQKQAFGKYHEDHIYLLGAISSCEHDLKNYSESVKVEYKCISLIEHLKQKALDDFEASKIQAELEQKEKEMEEMKQKLEETKSGKSKKKSKKKSEENSKVENSPKEEENEEEKDPNLVLYQKYCGLHAETLSVLADFHEKTDEKKLAYAAYKKSLEIRETLDTDTTQFKEIDNVYIRYGQFKIKNKEHEEGIELLHKALRFVSEHYGEDSTRIVVVYANMSSAYCDIDSPSEALDTFEEKISVQKILFEQNDLEYAKSYPGLTQDPSAKLKFMRESMDMALYAFDNDLKERARAYVHDMLVCYTKYANNALSDLTLMVMVLGYLYTNTPEEEDAVEHVKKLLEEACDDVEKLVPWENLTFGEHAKALLHFAIADTDEKSRKGVAKILREQVELIIHFKTARRDRKRRDAAKKRKEQKKLAKNKRKNKK
ncbi:MAG: tetratricopeptide repeat protein, partial [Promethearchaeota archaeon]